MRRRWVCAGIIASFIAISLAVLSLGSGKYATADTEIKEIVIEARQFEFRPQEISVRQGDRLQIVLNSIDTTHGLFIDGYDIAIRAVPGQSARLELIADKPGVFRLRCTQVCGNLHPFMVGRLTVGENSMLQTAWILSFVSFLAVLVTAGFGRGDVIKDPPSRRGGVRFDFLKAPLLRAMLRSRGLQYLLTLICFTALVLALLAAWRGSPVGSHNFGTVLLWMAWFPLIIVFAVLFGRLWCALCPLPAPGEWLSRIVAHHQKEGKILTSSRPWPARLRNGWLQNASLLAIAAVSPFVVTRPVLTAIVLAVFFVAANVLQVIFNSRAFCRYACPLSGFLSLSSVLSPVAVRVNDRATCRAHIDKKCIKGNSSGYGCPWLEYPGLMQHSAHCGLCLECVRTCSKGNTAFGLLPNDGSRLANNFGYDEAVRSFILLGTVGLYIALSQGRFHLSPDDPWTIGFALRTALLFGVSLIVLPVLLLGVSWLSSAVVRRQGLPVRTLWLKLSYCLLPLVILAWAALWLPAIPLNWYHVVSVLSDPFWRGWNLLGTADISSGPILTSWMPMMQAAVLLTGLIWSLNLIARLCYQMFPSRQALAFLPPGSYALALALFTLWLVLA